MPAIRFVADEMLGRLAKWLRILGYDTTYAPRISDYELIRQGALEGRIILTRDKKLPQKTVHPAVVVLESETYVEQCAELVRKLKLPVLEEKIFSRCLDCNTPVTVVEDLGKIQSLVPPYVYERHRSFHQCPACEKIYWSGSHYENTLRKIRAFPLGM